MSAESDMAEAQAKALLRTAAELWVQSRPSIRVGDILMSSSVWSTLAHEAFRVASSEAAWKNDNRLGAQP